MREYWSTISPDRQIEEAQVCFNCNARETDEGTPFAIVPDSGMNNVTDEVICIICGSAQDFDLT